MITATKPKIRRIPMSKARSELSNVIRRAHLNKEYVILEKDGTPIVGIMDADELEDYLELKDTELKRQIAEGYAAYRRGDVRDAREVLAEIKSGLRQRKPKAKKR